MSVTMSSRAAVSLVVLVALAGRADAQIISAPDRSEADAPGDRRAPAPATQRRRGAEHQLSLTGDLLAGADDNLSPEEGVSASPLLARRSGTLGTAAAAATYTRATATSNVRVTGNTHVTNYSGIDIRALIGANAAVQASKTLWGSTTVAGTASTAYRPTFTFANLNSALTLESAATVNPTAGGVTETRSRNLDVIGSLTQNWSTRHRTTLTGVHSEDHFRAGNADAYSQGLDVAQAWELHRNVGVLGSYRNSQQRSRELTFRERTLDVQEFSAGVELRKRISRTRRLLVSGGPTLTKVNTVSGVDDRPLEYFAPSGYVTARVDLFRTWALSTDWRREVTTIDGLVRQSFLTSYFALRTGGNIGRRWTAVAAASRADGRPHAGDVGSFEGAALTSQLQFAVSRCCSLVGSYSYYQHHLRDLRAVPAGLPRQFERNTAQIGMRVAFATGDDRRRTDRN
jgi:hypothetical protein